MNYNFREIEKKWQKLWEESSIYKTEIDNNKPKYYVLDMFPYPSGAGLHVGHPLGYIASDIVSRFKRHKGFNVLHPIGFDAFGLPAEQYAIQTGQHPAITTEENINQYKSQLKNIGFSFDWNREVQTSNPDFYKWTQWIFILLFESWYDKKEDKAKPIKQLVDHFENNGSEGIEAETNEQTPSFSANDWKEKSEKEKSNILNDYRMTYLDDALVNWCPELGTVLANDEVKDGFSERGGFPVERRKMKQWMMRITAYADRLLTDLNKLDWTASMKEMQSNWIGKSVGCELTFNIEDSEYKTTVFTTRPDTIFGATYMVLAPEHDLVNNITTKSHEVEVNEYIQNVSTKSERERISEKTISGVFTGSYAINPITDDRVPIWISDYVLAGYGTGAIMAVPSTDDRDFRFAKYFNLPITRVIEGTETLDDPTEIKNGKMINSGFLNGLTNSEAITKIIEVAEEKGLGKSKVNYRIRDAVFSRQRYWGEPVPIYFENSIPKPINTEDLPLVLPKIDKYKPTPEGDPPLGRAENWKYNNEYPYELTTMPGWAGSSWYFLRYMDSSNDSEFVSKEAVEYWQDVDLYIGGTEHATGHLLYSRFWNKVLYDYGFVYSAEPFKKLVNQGMIQGRSSLAYRIKNSNKYVSSSLKKNYDCAPIHVDISFVNANDELDVEKFKAWRPDLNDAEFILDEGKFLCDHTVEKMSKRLYNVVNPDEVVDKYGADSLRLYEMFLGPLEQSKPWDMHGIDGVHRFLKKLWANLIDENGEVKVKETDPSGEELKVLHKTIKKVEDDINNLSLNTSVSAFMICLSDLNNLKCNNKDIYESMLKLLSPFAPHICEELWSKLGNVSSIIDQPWPVYNEKYTTENDHEYPIMINGKLRTKISFPLDKDQEEIKSEVLDSEVVKKWVGENGVKKIIVVPKKIINVVV